VDLDVVAVLVQKPNRLSLEEERQRLTVHLAADLGDSQQFGEFVAFIPVRVVQPVWDSIEPLNQAVAYGVVLRPEEIGVQEGFVDFHAQFQRKPSDDALLHLAGWFGHPGGVGR
jgi:hypothetical protein